MATISPTDKDITISGKLTQQFLPDANNPRCSIVLEDIEWHLTGAPKLKTAIIQFQCRLSGESTGNELRFGALDPFLESKVTLKYTGNHEIKGQQVEIDAMLISLLGA